jgi:membrane protease YdiL (CAAX protease family)
LPAKHLKQPESALLAGVKMTKTSHAAKRGFLKRHGLSLLAGAILLLWVILYSAGQGQGHWSSFFGNAIADWSGVLVMVLATKHLYERGSKESKQPSPAFSGRVLEHIREHSLTIFLLITGAAWVALFARSDPQGKWGQVAGNIVSEWTQILGLVLMTKKLVEAGSKESK